MPETIFPQPAQSAPVVAGQRVADVAHRTVEASQSMNQGDIIAAANFARAAVAEVLTVTRAAAVSAETTEGRYRIMDSGREVAVKLHDLLLSLHNVHRTSGETNLISVLNKVLIKRTRKVDSKQTSRDEENGRWL